MRVTWVHPTWRDLVIDDLARDARRRRQFLTRCGVHGLLLALAVAGGAAGERRLPLLVADDDWDVAGDRLHALLGDLEAREQTTVLRTLTVAVSDGGDARTTAEADALARVALARTAAGWSDGRTSVPLGLLDAWLTLSKTLRAPILPPPLGATWAELLPASAPDPADRVAVQRFTDWLTLCEMLDRFSPALLTSLGFGHEHAALCTAFLERVESEPECRAHDHVARALEAIAANSIELRERALGPMRSMRGEPGGEAPAAGGRGWEVAARDDFDVARVLADL